MIRAALAVALIASAAGCDRRRPSLADCGGDLRGIWRIDGTARRYHAIVGAGSWELYPMFDDTRPDHPAGLGEDVVAGPGLIELDHGPRGAPALTGTWARRFERAGAICTVTTPVRLHGCRGDRAELEVQPPQPPADFTGCAAAPPGVVARWRLVRE